jgi:ubiquinone/menaquinone biosynthesis C-methylase UbiE
MMHRLESSQRYYDDFSKSYDRGRDRGYHAMIDELELAVLEPYARGKSVLEAGCGTGLILDSIDRIAARAVGVDLSSGMLSHAKSRGLSVVQGSVTALPFADQSFDTVCSFKVLAHVPEIDRAIAELARVTRPGGHLVLEFYNRWSLRYLARRASGARKIGASHDEGDIPTRWDSPREILDRLPSFLTPIEVRGVRVVTPAAMVHRIEPISRAISAAERLALRSPLRWFGGFLVVVLARS